MARRVCEIFPTSRFWLAGPIDAGPAGVPGGIIQSWEQEGAIRYLGAVEDVPGVLQKADVFVLPTYYREGVPRTILEALACGLPVITTDTPGCRDTVIEGENGFLIPPRDPRALADRMLTFLRKPELVTAMGERSRRLAEEKFDARRITEQVMGEIEARAFLQGDASGREQHGAG